MWDWLQNLQGGAPVIVGSAVGSAFGIISLLIGALFNAYLNRRRDDRLRRSEQTGILTALIAEIDNVIDTLKRNADELAKPRKDFRVPDPAQSFRILPKSIDKLYLLPQPAIQAAINAQTIIDQYSDHLVFLGGTLVPDIPKGRVIFIFPKESATRVKAINEGSIDILSEYVKTIRESKVER